ncbi:MAG: hypothetical protein KAT65_17565, partial [Methanophagales archaeon]|nr:hypothetical protein [Methanophagales archaeon]
KFYYFLKTESLLKVKVQAQSLPRLQLRFRSSAKSIAPRNLHSPKNLLKICMVGCEAISGVGA